MIKDEWCTHNFDKLMKKYTVSMLKDLLRSNKLRVGGIKKELVYRLIEYNSKIENVIL